MQREVTFEIDMEKGAYDRTCVTKLVWNSADQLEIYGLYNNLYTVIERAVHHDVRGVGAHTNTGQKVDGLEVLKFPYTLPGASPAEHAKSLDKFIGALAKEGGITNLDAERAREAFDIQNVKGGRTHA